MYQHFQRFKVFIPDQKIVWKESNYGGEYAYIDGFINETDQKVSILINTKIVDKNKQPIGLYYIIGSITEKMNLDMCKTIKYIKTIANANDLSSPPALSDYCMPAVIVSLSAYKTTISDLEGNITNLQGKHYGGLGDIVTVFTSSGKNKSYTSEFSTIDISETINLNKCRFTDKKATIPLSFGLINIVIPDYSILTGSIGYARKGLLSIIARNTNLGLNPPALKITGSIDLVKAKLRNSAITSIIAKVRNDIKIETINFSSREWNGEDYFLPRSKKSFWRFYANKWHSLSSILLEAKASNIQDPIDKDVMVYLNYLHNNIPGTPLIFDHKTFMFIITDPLTKRELVFVERRVKDSATYVFLDNSETIQYIWSRVRLTTIYKFQDNYRLLNRCVHKNFDQWKNEITRYADLFTNDSLRYNEVWIRSNIWVESDANGYYYDIDNLKNIFNSFSKVDDVCRTVLWAGRHNSSFVYSYGYNHKSDNVRRYAFLCTLYGDLDWSRIEYLAFDDSSERLMKFIYRELLDHPKAPKDFMEKYLNHSVWMIRDHYINNTLLDRNYSQADLISLFGSCNPNSALRRSIISLIKFDQLSLDLKQTFADLLRKWKSFVSEHFVIIIDHLLGTLVEGLFVQSDKVSISDDSVTIFKCVTCSQRINFDVEYVLCYACNNYYCSDCTQYLKGLTVCYGSLFSGSNHQLKFVADNQPELVKSGTKVSLLDFFNKSDIDQSSGEEIFE